MKNKFITLAVAVIMIVMATTVTAFAATGTWKATEGIGWQYLDKEGEPQAEVWAKSGDDWFWLNSDGVMAASTLVSDKDTYFYVDADGKMVNNTWVRIDNDDFNDRWLFFGANGKAYKDGWKTIANKKYFFEDYAMNYGFLDADGKMIDKDSDLAWADAVYYCGSDNEGAQVTGWLKVDAMDEDNGFAWLYFGTNGKKYVDCTKQINGKTYVFKSTGAMKVSFDSATISTASSAVITKYLNEDGSMVKKGWIYAYADENADEQNWFYAAANGELIKGIVKTINNKKYAFDADGKMLTGFVEVTDTMEVVGPAFAAENVKFADAVGTGLGNKYMYFTENVDPAKQGAAFSGKSTIAIDDATLTVNFSSRGIAESSNGAFVIKKNYAYVNSVLYAREDMDYKYEVITDEAGDLYVLTVKTGKASKKGTFTDNDNNIRYIIKDGIVTIQHKDANGKWA